MNTIVFIVARFAGSQLASYAPALPVGTDQSKELPDQRRLNSNTKTHHQRTNDELLLLVEETIQAVFNSYAHLGRQLVP
jgi:hypothetical protein